MPIIKREITFTIVDEDSYIEEEALKAMLRAINRNKIIVSSIVTIPIEKHMKTEYDFTGGIRGKYYARYWMDRIEEKIKSLKVLPFWPFF